MTADGKTPRMSQRMIWPIDECSRAAALQFPLPIQVQPIPQEAGPNFFKKSWDDCLLAGDDFAKLAAGVRLTAPSNIIAEFQRGHLCNRYLPALALTACWGTMWRRKKDIYDRNRWTINCRLKECAESIRRTKSIKEAWRLLTSREDREVLGWTSVMASKALHFLCRALGFEKDPPVPIDGIIRDRIWWAFRGSIVPPTQRPGDWGSDDDHTFEAYCRYMTVILTWAQTRDWTTTEMEATIYGQYR
jgi:hypothetical protein